MYFEERELSLSAKPVETTEFIEGEVYFSVSYLDDDKLIPDLKSYLFVGRDLAPDDSGQLHFQVMDPVHRETSSENGYVEFPARTRDRPDLLEYEQALEELMRCSLRRRGPLKRSGETSAASILCFEARQLKGFGESVRPIDLVEGSIYFSLFFLDDEFLIPGLEPYIFLGQNLEAEEDGFYFQDLDSYRRGVRHGKAAGDQSAMLLVESVENISLLNYEQALEELMACSLRRRETAT